MYVIEEIENYQWPENPDEKFQQQVELVNAVVSEMRDAVAEYHTALIQAKIALNPKGVSIQMPQASLDPQKASELHRIRMACDHFLNALNGQY